MKGLSLSKFKKMKETKDWATLIHEDGHQLNIAKAPLSRIQRKQLEALETHEINQYAFGGRAQGDISDDVDQVPAPSDPGAPPPVSDQTPLEIEAIPEASPPQGVPGVSNAEPSQPQTQVPFQTLGQAQNQGLEQEQAANLDLARAQGQEGQAEAQAYRQNLAQQQALPTQSQVLAGYQGYDDELRDHFNKQIMNPDHYFDNHSKISAGLGILLSGFGQAVGQGRAGGNDAFSAIQNNINRDIDAQKENKSQALTLWQMNRQLLHSDLAANLLTQNQLNTALQYKLSKAAADAKTPQALAQAQINNAKIQQLKDGNTFKLALLNPTSDNPDPASRVQFLVPQERQQKVIDEINAAKNTVTNTPGIVEAFNQAATEVRPFTGGKQTSLTAFVPGMQSPAQKAFLARTFPTVQEQEGSVRQNAFDNIEHHFMPQFGDSNSTIESKRESLHDYLRSKSAASASKSFGIDLTKFPSTNTTGIGRQPAIAKQAIQPGVRYERQIINGKPYRVPVGKN